MQYGSQEGKLYQSSILNKVFTYNLFGLTKTNRAVTEFDAMANYDWMIPALVSMACCCLGMGKNVCNMMLDAMENMEHRFQTAHGILVTTYWTIKLYKVFGTGQGSEGSSSFWLAVSGVMFKCIDKDLKGVTFVNPAWSITSARVEDAFVENTLMMINDKSGRLVEVLKKTLQIHEKYL